LKREEIAEGRILLSQKLEQFAPQVIAFNGKGTFENFAQRACKLGLQKGVLLWRAGFCAAVNQRTERRTGRAPKLSYFRQLAKLLSKLPK